MAAGAKVKTNVAGANGATTKGGKAAKTAAAPAAAPTPSPIASGTATPIGEDITKGGVVRASRPDKTVYDAEQEALKVKIAELQEKMSAIQNKINAGSNAGPGAERRTELRGEWDKIRQEQGKFKNSRGQLLAQLKTLNEGIAKKIKDLQAAKGKTQFKSVADVDAHIKQLEKQVESGSMKLVEEKRALAEISSCKRLRRTVESFQADQESIERDRAAVEELRRQLDDPEAKAVSERADSIKAQLDQIKKDGDEAYANRNKLYEERNEIKAQLDEIFHQKRESALRFREENDRYWAKVNEDRTRRAERARQQRQAEEEAKKKETALRLLEEAEAPAFQAQIEDCQTLIDYFSGKTSGAIRLSTSTGPLAVRGEVAGVPKLELRQVESDTAGLVARKKKGEDEEAYFVGGKGKKGGRKGGAKAAPAATNGDTDTVPSPSSSGPLNVPLPTLSALLSLSIPPPASAADVPRTITDLQTKKAWFEVNQARATAENVAKAEAEIQKLLGSSSSKASVDAPPNGSGENPPEPAPTPSQAEELDGGVSAGEVDVELEDEVSKGEIEATV